MDRTPDLFTIETREQKRARLYAAATRWAKRLPSESGEDHRRTYQRMIGNFLAALKT